MKICFRCRKEINDEDNYFTMIEMNYGKEVKTDYVHKVCWDVFLNQISDTTEAMGVVRGLKGYLQRTGIIEPESVVIK